MPAKHVWLVVGLGNPGTDYADTRHNAGFLVIDAVAATWSITIHQKKFNVEFGRGRIDGVDTILVKPQAYMNKSGLPVKQVGEYFKISYRDMLVIHDDIDLEFGRLKIKEKGGHGGHNGVRSLIGALGEDAFARLRVGVGRSGNDGNDGNVVNHVLGRFCQQEKAVLDKVIGRARDAVETILCEGTREGMNRFNDRRIHISS
ncbi:MAG: aminoacyl-tRNA hydrolase [Deltaproteobacteria bacterium]|nr:aminoacyl-tRNA hydrolase [Deltaproteobacteria bacterium]MBW2634484.1 aminoacyl-tRNA hydrolase [Deltaproteobacteria bacterium]MBW2677630.1 aminoacyl-tRNA hydrolase [Deltaproteobacteria bacterium]